MLLKRTLNIKELLQKKSFFLFGPRATGKTSLIRNQLKKDALIIDLLKSDTYMHLSTSPWDLEKIILAEPGCKYVVIDEIQKIPLLLNEVHRLIEERSIKFLLTGSSARKLKAQHVNLLAGRAWKAHLNPLTMHEIPNFSLQRYLTYGGLPSIYLSDSPIEELQAYVSTYLKDEIQIEAAIRKIQAFTKFLNFAALTSGKILNFSSIANDSGVSATTIREYYQILEDTLIGSIVPSWQKSTKRKAISHAKFYFFDVGVMHRLSGTKTVEKNTDVYGFAFEHFIYMEIKSYIDYKRLINAEISFWCTKHGQEVDFIIGDEIAIEVKTCNIASNKHLKGLKTLQEENICKKYFLISFDKVPMFKENIRIIYWEEFIKLLWDDKIITEDF